MFKSRAQQEILKVGEAKIYHFTVECQLSELIGTKSGSEKQFVQ